MGVVHGQEMVLNIGPQHPATHGVLRLQVKTDGEIISEITPYMGYLHRCFEKHCENVTYEQVIPFTDRCDYLASMTMNFGYVVAMEQLMEIKVSDRVEYIRVIMAELQRIASHLLGIGAFGLDLGAFTPFLHMLRDRERILEDAIAVADAGAFSVVLEMLTETISEEVTKRIDIPTIGIGASVMCDGQVLVVDDLLGIFNDFKPKFVKHYEQLGTAADRAISEYALEVRSRKFPSSEHVFEDSSSINKEGKK